MFSVSVPCHDDAMAEIVNLRRVKKARARDDAERQAAANRALHGRSRMEREAAATEQRRQDRLLDGSALDRDGEPGE